MKQPSSSAVVLLAALALPTPGQQLLSDLEPLGSFALDRVGSSVAVSGGRIAGGAPYADDAEGGAGAVDVFSPVSPTTTLAHEKRLTSSDRETDDPSGTSVALFDWWAAAGARGDANGVGGGAAFVYDVASVFTYGCTDPNQPGSLVSLAFLAVTAQELITHPCGVPVPDWGMAGGGGELPLAPTPQPILLGPSTWGGAVPAPVSLSLPDNPAPVGVSLHAQGVMLGSAGSEVQVGLTEAFRSCIGVAVPESTRVAVLWRGPATDAPFREQGWMLSAPQSWRHPRSSPGRIGRSRAPARCAGVRPSRPPGRTKFAWATHMWRASSRNRRR